jgi:mono/diheme cytochrome c family protein
MRGQAHILMVVAMLAGLFLQACDGSRQTASAVAQQPSGDESYRRRLGLDTYRYYCEACHGAEGKGDGFNAFNLDPKPPDFTSASFQDARTDEQIAAAIADGGPGVGRSTAMPPWRRTLSASQRAVVLLHVRRFRHEASGTQ